MTLICRQIVRQFFWTMAAVVSIADVARSQDDVEPVEANLQVEQARAERVRQAVRMNNLAIANGSSGQLSTGIGSAEALEKRLVSRISELQALYHLSEAQVEKLHLAGRGDIKRYADRLDSLVKGMTESENSGLAREMRDLERTRDRLFDDGSLLSKTIVNTLSQEQLAQIEATIRQENMLLYRDAVKQAAHSLAGLANLSVLQTDELSKLILAETRPPRRFGRSDYALVMFQASTLSESKLEPIFLEDQWKVLKAHFKSWSDAEQFLKSEGFVFDDTPVSPSARSRADGGRIVESQRKEGTQP